MGAYVREPLHGLEDFPVELFEVASQRIWIHTEEACEGACPYHNPSKHHMRYWPLDVDKDHRIRRICPHGVLHSDPDVVTHLEGRAKYSLHICDGCCQPPDLPTLEEISVQLNFLLEIYHVDQ